MKFAVLTVAALIASAAAAPLTEEQYQFLFSKFSQQFNKQYEVENVFSKYQTFKNNVDLIVAHNASGQSYSMEVNKFADLTTAEFNQFMGLKVVGQAPAANLDMSNPCTKSQGFEKIDWVAAGVIAAPKDQGQCGSCWAFATTGALEPAIRIARKADISLDLSEQALVDCSSSYGNEGCNGGLMSSAYQYIVSVGGLPNTKDYKYTGRDGTCKKDAPINPVSKLSGQGYVDVPTGDAGHIEALKKGPVAVALARYFPLNQLASSSAFQFYSKGVVSNCTDRSINHGVTLVATGTEGGKDFYRIRNSWGSSWGDAGYINLEYGSKQCGLTTSSFDAQPTL